MTSSTEYTCLDFGRTDEYDRLMISDLDPLHSRSVTLRSGGDQLGATGMCRVTSSRGLETDPVPLPSAKLFVAIRHTFALRQGQ